MTVALRADEQEALEALARREFPPTRYPHLYEPEEIAALSRDLLSGDLRRDASTLEAILLGYGVEVCHDSRSHRTYWRRTGAPLWTASTDRYTADLRERIAADHRAANHSPLAYGDDTWRRSLNALLHHRERDLFADYLDTLPDWDGTSRLDTWLVAVFDVGHEVHDGLVRWAARYPLIAAVELCHRPGAKIRRASCSDRPPGLRQIHRDTPAPAATRSGRLRLVQRQPESRRRRQGPIRSPARPRPR